jgi:hypothetical protein
VASAVDLTVYWVLLGPPSGVTDVLAGTDDLYDPAGRLSNLLSSTSSFWMMAWQICISRPSPSLPT